MKLVAIILAVILSAAMAAPVPSIPIHVFSSSQTTNIEGSYSQCCGGGASVTIESVMTRSSKKAPNASLSVTGACSGVACDCYSSSQTQNVLDLTPLYNQCKGGSATVYCTLDLGCPYQAVNISYVEVNKGPGNNGYWPAPLNGSCVDNDGFSCANVTLLRNYSFACTGMESCSVNMPLVDPSTTGGALYATIYAVFGGECGNMNCGYVGHGSYYTSCILQSVQCP